MYKCKKDFKLYYENSSRFEVIKKGTVYEMTSFVNDCVLLWKWADETPVNIKLNYNIFKDYFKEIKGALK